MNPHRRLLQAASSQPPVTSWPSFTGTATFLGTSPIGQVSVYYDATLGAPGLQNAQDLLADADRIVAANNAIFGITGGPVNVIVFAIGGATDGTGGADHMGCDFSTGNNIEVCASFGNSMRCSALFEAELSEDCMNGSLCGYSTGEALSRWCAMAVGNNSLTDFASAPTWAQDGFADWVDTMEPTDQDYDSIGCGVAFISWLLSLKYTLPAIAQALVSEGDSGTLAQLYASLSGDAARVAWAAFMAAINALPGGVTTDDPFNELGSVTLPSPGPAPIPAPVPSPTPPPGPAPAPAPVPPPAGASGTVPLAALDRGGAQGSLTIVGGLITAFTAPTEPKPPAPRAPTRRR